MREDERKIATKAIKEGLKRGWSVALHDEEGLVVQARKFEPFEGELGASEVQQVLFYGEHFGDPQDNGPSIGTLSFVFGNEPGVLIADSGGTKEFDSYLDFIDGYAQGFQE